MEKAKAKRNTIWLGFFIFRLTRLLEDVQKVLSVNIDEEDEKTLEKISQDISTLRKIWRKVRQRPTEALSGKKNKETFGTLCSFFLALLSRLRKPIIW